MSPIYWLSTMARNRVLSLLASGKKTAGELKDILGIDYKNLFEQLSFLIAQQKVRTVLVTKNGINVIHYEACSSFSWLDFFGDSFVNL